MLEFKDPIANTTDSNFNEVRDAGLAYLHPSSINTHNQTIKIDKKNLTNCILNSCLGIESDDRIKQGIIKSTTNLGAGFYAPQPFLLPPEHQELELLLSKVFDSNPIIALSTTLAHLGAITTLVQKNDLLILDFYAHQSMRLAINNIPGKIQIKTIAHNDTQQLERIIKKHYNDPNINNIWYFADGIYSMQGDYAPLKKIDALLKKYENFYAYLDDAHGMSVLGKNGKGYVLGFFEKQPEKLVVAASLSKSFGMGCGAAIVLANAEWKRKIKTCGPTFIFTTPLPTAIYGAGIASAKIHLSPEITKLQNELHKRISFFQTKLSASQSITMENNGQPSQIFYLKTQGMEQALKLGHYLKENGFFTGVCPYPVVSKNCIGVRIVLSVNHSLNKLEELANLILIFFSQL